jgi:acyl dehydratase
VTLTFSDLPANGPLYWRAAVSRKPRLVPAGAVVPRLEATWTDVRVDVERLRAYRALCGFRDDAGLPVTFPHVMVSAMHLAMLASPAFPVRLLGLVHLKNRIEALAPLPESGGGTMHAWLEGHHDGERLQTFELHTEWRDGAAVRWRETSTFIARKPAGPREGPKPVPPPRPTPTSTATFHVPPGLGRRYSALGGDINPIHLFDVTAKLFGFPRAIIHGMWTLARCVAELKPAAPCVVDVQFKLPVFIPSTVTLERVAVAGGEDFTVVDARAEKPHLVGTLR